MFGITFDVTMHALHGDLTEAKRQRDEAAAERDRLAEAIKAHRDGRAGRGDRRADTKRLHSILAAHDGQRRS